MSPLYCPSLNGCVDEILENKQNFKFMKKQLAKQLKVSTREIESKHTVRHRTSKKQVPSKAICLNSKKIRKTR